MKLDKTKFMYVLAVIVVAIITVLKYTRHFIKFDSIPMFTKVMAIIALLSGIALIYGAIEKHDWLTENHAYKSLKKYNLEQLARFLYILLGALLILLSYVGLK